MVARFSMYIYPLAIAAFELRIITFTKKDIAANYHTLSGKDACCNLYSSYINHLGHSSRPNLCKGLYRLAYSTQKVAQPIPHCQ